MNSYAEKYLSYNFHKIKLLKKSSRGEVWLAENKLTGDFVVMKFVNFSGLPYAKLKKIPHELWAKIFYCAEDSADTVVVEEFITGENLADKKISETLARKILLQLCDGLKVLHGAGIIHRDIKPSNLILQTGEILRLIDFDVARTVKTDKHSDTSYFGTRGYAPPEQFGFGQTDARSDIFSLGVTFQELVGGNCSRGLKKILAKCTELDPANRYQSVEELKSALLAKKNFPRKKILAASLIFAGILFFHANLQEETFPEPEKVVEQKLPAKKIPERPAEKIVEFPEITIPAALEVKNSPPPVASEIPATETNFYSGEDDKIVSAKYFLNGEAISDWQEYEVSVMQIQKADWQKFFDWTVEMRVKDFSADLAKNPRLKVVCESDSTDYRAEKILSGTLRGEEIIFTIPLAQFNFRLVEPVTHASLQITLLDNSGADMNTRAYFQFSFLAI